jgi:tetratricopeptide (TPR) repeat protein/WD40 repeat protein
LAWEIAEADDIRREFALGSDFYESQPRIAFDPRGWLLATTGPQGNGLAILDERTGKILAAVPGGGYLTPRFDPLDRSLLTASDRGLHRWPVTTQERNAGDQSATHVKIGPPQSLGVVDTLWQWDLTKDGKRAVAVSVRQFPGATIVNLDQSTIALDGIAADHVAFSGDGRWIVLGSGGGHLSVRDARTGAVAKTWRLTDPVQGRVLVDASDDGEWIAASTSEGLKLIQMGTWETRWTIPLVQSNYGSYAGLVGFSPDNRHLAYAKSAKTIALVNRETGEEVAQLPLDGPFSMNGLNFSFSADGAKLAVGREQMTGTVWDLRTLRAELDKIGLDWEGPSFPAAPTPATGKLFVTIDPGEENFPPYPLNGTPQQMIDYYSAWIDREPELSKLYQRRAYFLEQTEALQPAADDLATYLAAYPHDAAALAVQVRLFDKLGKADAAEEAFEKLLALEPSQYPADLLARNLIGITPFMGDGNWERGYRAMKRAVEFSENRRCRGLLGLACYRLAKYDEAETALEKKLATRDDFEIFEVLDRLHLAMAQRQLGKMAEANGNLDLALARFEQAHTYISATDTAALRKYRDEALALFGRPLPTAPAPNSPPSGDAKSNP